MKAFSQALRRGSKTTLSFPKSYAPVGPPLVVPPERDLDAEIRQLEMELAGGQLNQLRPPVALLFFSFEGVPFKI